MKLLGLKQIRETYGFTMRELGEKLGVTANTINMWEKGTLDATDDRVAKLMEVLSLYSLNDHIIFTNEHSDYDKMLIEVSRAKYKIEEYRSNLSIDSPEFKKTVVERLNSLQIDFFIKEDALVVLNGTIRQLIDIYKNNTSDNYLDFDDYFTNFMSMVEGGSKELKKFKIVLDCLQESESMDSWEDDYMLFCSAEDVFQKNVRDNLENLYKLYEYKSGRYKPDWFDEE